MLLVVAFAAALACASVGGGFYEVLVVDPFWPKRPDLVQPSRGGISRKRFWIAVHVAFEVVLIAALVWSWRSPPSAPACWWRWRAMPSCACGRPSTSSPRRWLSRRPSRATITEAAARAWTAAAAAPAARFRDVRSHAVGLGIGRPAGLDQAQALQIVGGFSVGRWVDGTLRGPYFPPSFGIPPARPGLLLRSTMKIRHSLKSVKARHKDSRIVRRKGRVYVINKTNPRFKARQG